MHWRAPSQQLRRRNFPLQVPPPILIKPQVTAPELQPKKEITQLKSPPPPPPYGDQKITTKQWQQWRQRHWNSHEIRLVVASLKSNEPSARSSGNRKFEFSLRARARPQRPARPVIHQNPLVARGATSVNKRNKSFFMPLEALLRSGATVTIGGNIWRESLRLQSVRKR